MKPPRFIIWRKTHNWFGFYVCHVEISQITVPLATLLAGKSELITTNALIGRSIHWKGCIFSFGAKWGSSLCISFFANHCNFYFLFLVLDCFPFGPDHTHRYLVHFPSLFNFLPSEVLHQPWYLIYYPLLA
jgi:hypothetical protein